MEKEKSDKKIWRPVKEFAELKEISVQAVYQSIRDGRLSGKKIGNYQLVSE
jgi:predicted DNA-binding protein YlxM (UPF0122 family)